MSKKLQINVSDIAKEAAIMPLEQPAMLRQGNSKLFIGIPKEITYQENRVPLTPSAVAYLVNNGHIVHIETNVGKAANFTDKQYADAGAIIVYKHEEVFEADVIIKIDPPTGKEIDLLKPGKTIFSALQLNNVDEVLINKLMQKRVTAIAYEFIQDESGSFPIIRAMSEIAGQASVLIAAEYLNNSHVGKGELLGGFTGIPPTQIVIIGAGAVGEYAAKAAVGLGANVKVFDNQLYRLRRLQKNLGQQVYTSTIHPTTLADSLKSADVAIGALRGTKGRSPIVVTEKMVMEMKPRSVIIDVSIDQGGVFETSEPTNHEKPIYRKHEVIHFCIPNITSRVSRTASYALSNIFTPILTDIADNGGLYQTLRERKGLRQGVYVFKGMLCSQTLADRFNMKSKDVDLILGAFME